MSELQSQRPQGDPWHRLPQRATAGEEEPVLPAVDVRQLIGMLRRQARLLVVGGLLGTALAILLVAPEPPTYRAQSTVRVVNDRSALTSGITSDPASDPKMGAGDPIQSQIQILTSETVLGDVVDTLGLRLQSLTEGLPSSLLRNVEVAPGATVDTVHLSFSPRDFRASAGEVERTVSYGGTLELPGLRFQLPSAPQVDSATLVVLARPQAVAFVRDGLQVQPREQTDAIDIVFTSPDRLLATRVANAVAQTAYGFSGRFAQRQSQRRRVFIEQQLQQTDSALGAAQAALDSFRSRSELFNAQDRMGYQQSQLLDLNQQREKLITERRAFATFLASLQSTASSDSGLRTLLSTPGLSTYTQEPIVGQLYAQLVQYETERASMTSGPGAKSATDPDVQRLAALIRDTRANLLNAVRGHVSSLDEELALVEGRRARAERAMQTLPAQAAEELRLQQRVEGLRDLSAQLRSEAQRARIAEMVESGQLEVLDLAGSATETPGNTKTIIALWGLLGMLLGGGVGGVREVINRSVRRPDELEALLQVPELAVIPPISKGKRLGRGSAAASRPAGDSAPGSRPTDLNLPSIEAFRLLRTNLSFHSLGPALQTIVVTSTDPAEGKSTLVANLASVSAMQGQRVLVIDADLRRPCLHQTFRVDRDPGLAQYLSQSASAWDTVHPTSIPNLSLVPAGQSTPADLFPHFSRVSSFFEELSAHFDLVLIDTPPLRAAADASFLSAIADGVILVVRAGKTDRESLQDVRQGLRKVGANVIGAVMNDPDAELPRYAGRYSYRYAYYARSE